MSDDTTAVRISMASKINSDVASDDPTTERARLESIYGKVYDTSEMKEHFEPKGFGSPFIVVTRKSDGKRGSLEFQHRPRFYFNFVED